MKRILIWLAAILTVVIWAETFISTKLLLEQGLLPPDIFIYRFFLAYCGIWVLCAARRRRGAGITSDGTAREGWVRIADEMKFIALGMLGGSLYFLCENTALEYSTASNVAILVGSAPLLTGIVVGIAYKEERLSARQWLGSLIAFIGMAMVILNGQLVLHLNPAGDSLAIGAAVVWAFYSLVIRKVSGRYDIILITRKIFGYGLLTMMIYLLAIRGFGNSATHPFPGPLAFDPAVMSRPAVWGNLLYLGIVASLLCFIVWNYALKELGTTRTTNIIYGQSLITMLISAIVLNERITLMAITGAIVLIAGMLLAVRKKGNRNT
ncbi:MAG: DMT family transporter [Bacteroidales bacterium]|nr:DMT family transporter [Bacteroidales bacterium]